MAERQVAAIVLAAGKSTRMGADRPKVLHPVCGRPMLAHVLDACYGAAIDDVRVVVGHGKEQLIESFDDDPRITWVEQNEQMGTGHAVMMCESSFAGFEGDVLVIAGDMPLVRAATLRRLLAAHRHAGAAVSLATCELDDPTGYGRIVRDDRGQLAKIVEHNDCTAEQKSIREVNISYYCFDCTRLFAALGQIKPDNAKGEYYITDVVDILIAAGAGTATLPGVPPEDALGVNAPEDLSAVEAAMQRRIAEMQPN